MEDEEKKLKQKESKTTLNYIFAKEDVNLGHQPEFDYLKTVGVFCIIVTHFMDHFTKGYIYIIVDYLDSILGAAGLMIIMGIGAKYSRHHEIRNYISRGILLLTKGQCVNLLKNTLPNLIAWWSTREKKFISRALLVLQTDIFNFSGFAFLFLALMKKMKISENFILSIGIIMNIMNFILYKIMKIPNFLLRQFLGYFITTKAESIFSFCSYFVFVSFGYWLGDIYKKIANKNKFYNLILIFCLPFATLYYYFRSYYNVPTFPECFSDEQYILFPGPDAIALCMFNLAFLAIFYKIDTMLKGKTPYFVSFAAKNLDQFYVIHYFIIMQILTFLKATRGDDFPTKIKYPSIYALTVIALCKILIDINNKYIHITISTLKNPMRNFIFAFIWILTIISVIYIYPKVEVYATLWNYYLYEI